MDRSLVDNVSFVLAFVHRFVTFATNVAMWTLKLVHVFENNDRVTADTLKKLILNGIAEQSARIYELAQR